MFLGVDLGTSSIKLSISDINGNILKSYSVKNDLTIINNNWVEQNPNEWLDNFFKGINYLNNNYDLKKLIGISFCGQMHGLVILDENDKVIRPAILWNDNRTIEETNYINNYFTEDKLINLTGNICFPGFTLPKLLWLKNHELNNFKKIKKIMLPKDYLSYKLTNIFASDVSDLSGTLLFDIKNRCYQKEILDFIGISYNQLPKILESYNVVGTIRKEIADKYNLSINTKVIIGGGDQAVGAISTNTIKDNSLSISLGTSGVVFCSTDKPIIDKRLHSFCHANGKYHLMGVILSCTQALNWFTNLVNDNDLEELFLKSQDLEINNLIFHPYLIGERSPIVDSNAKGMFYGLELSFNKYHLFKAVVEGISFALKDCLNTILEHSVKPKFARVIGGGSKSIYWMQILSDILNLELRTININDGGTLGAIILAMYGCGYLKSLDDINDIIKDEKVFYPKKNYDHKFDAYKCLYKNNKTIFSS